VENVVLCHRDILVKHIHGQLQRHFEEPEYRYSSKIERNFAVLKTAFIPLPEGQEPLPYDKTPDNISLISSYVFTGFTKSQYTLCKFHSNTERVFACILEQDLEVKKWIRPHRESLNLFYHKDKQYEPDFIVETASHCYLCEVKSSAELDDLVVLQKANAAVKWCEAATEHALKNNGKPWAYLLVPHTEVRLTSSFQGLAGKFLWKTGKRNKD
jgi:type III restriction enzyme